MNTEEPASNFRFGPFELQPRERRLLANGEPTGVAPRAFELLLALVERAGRLVTKDELLSLAWPGLVVEENNLQVQVSALRKVLGHDAIDTVPGKGYRFTPIIESSAARRLAPSAPLVHGLPQPLTSFIGHDEDLTAYAHMLEKARLLTLTGIGGCGKTRLAIKLAEAVAPTFGGGAWFVDLAPILDGERVPMTVAAAFNADATRDGAILDSICGAIANKPCLLVLDNCEHVLEACASLVRELLERRPSLHILATSREGLGIAGERIAAVRTLSLPGPDWRASSAVPDPTEAIRLFLDRAQMVSPGLVLDERSGPAIAEICRRLDGIPLAIELAAARVKLLALEQIENLLRDRFRLLVGGGKSVSRHRTLKAVIGWSYEQLQEPERRLLRRLSVFVGSWALGGAIAMTPEGDDEMQVLTLLDRLVDVSLITVQRSGSGETRYQMLETVRQYAEERLIDAGERDDARGRHLDYYLGLIEATIRNATEARGEWEEDIKRFDRDRENFLSAHAWCDHAVDGAQKGIRLANGMRWYWFTSDAYESDVNKAQRSIAIGVRMLLEALARPGLATQTLDGARAHLNVGNMLRERGQHHLAKPHLDQGLAIAQHLGRRSLVANAFYFLSEHHRDLREFGAAMQHLEQARAMYEEDGKTRGLIAALMELGMLHCLLGDHATAEQRMRDGLTLARTKGVPWDVVLGHLHLSVLECRRRSPTAAAAHLIDALGSATDLRSQALYGYALESAIGVAVLLNEHQRGVRYFGALEAYRLRRNLDPNAPYDTDLLAIIAAAKRVIGDSAYESAFSSGQCTSLNDAVSDAGNWLDSIVDAK